MTDDIVDRLRTIGTERDLDTGVRTWEMFPWAAQAAEEIERLREDVRIARAETNLKAFRLDDALDAVKALRQQLRIMDLFTDHYSTCSAHVSTWEGVECTCGLEKARHGIY